MALRESKEVLKREPSRMLTPFDEMENLFEEYFRRPFSMLAPTWYPRTRLAEAEEVPVSLDVYEHGDNVVVKAEIPGIHKEDIEVNFSNNTLILSGEKKKEEKIESKDFYRMERFYGAFSRSVRLPVDVQAEKATATFRDGVLEISIPKTEESKQKMKKITIQ